MDFSTAKQEQLNKNLVKLQETGGVVMCDLRVAHKNLFKHLSEIYFWWANASQQDNYLEDEYKKLARKFRTVTYGINFAPLLWLVYGNNSGLNNQYADRYSRALNAMHKEVSKKPAYYAKDGVAKLVSFIEQSGGTAALAGYAPPEDNSSSSKSAINTENAEAQKLQIQNILKQSWMLGKYRIDTQLPVEYPTYFNTTSDDFAVLLVKRTAQGFEIVDVDSSDDGVNTLLANTLRKRFDLCVFSIRPLLELIYTQCLPQSLEALAEKLVDITTLQEGKKTKKVHSHRRVFYRAETNEFVLSPMNATTGVVSIVKPYFDLLLDGCEKDVYMPYAERNNIETNLLRNFEFNLYDTELKTTPVPEYPELNTASHVVHLRHRTDNNQFQNISFWPFYSSLEQPQNQLLVKEDYKLTPKWYAHIDRDEIKRINDEFLNHWLSGHARYINRDAHTILQFTFADTWLAVEFVNEDGLFVNRQKIDLKPIEVSNKTVTVLFRTKDIVPALNCLADLPIIKKSEPVAIDDLIADDETDVKSVEPYTLQFADMDDSYRGGLRLELDDNVLRIHFYTDGLGGAEHTIYVPTANTLGAASEIPFYSYTAQVTADNSLDAVAVNDEDILPLLVEVE